jgi:flagellar assembly protein FliH
MLLPESQRLLKANAARELGARVAFNFEDLRQEGETYLNQVRTQAAALVQAAQQEAASIRESAYREAREAGRRDGLQDAARQIEEQAARIADERLTERVATTLPALSAVAEAMRQELDRWLVRWEETAVRTAVAIAEKLLHRELQQKPELAVGMIREALKLAAGHPHLRVHLHPDDARHLGENADAVIRALTACADATLVSDSTISPGGCRIETRHGEIDARLETMLQRIAEELLS